MRPRCVNRRSAEHVPFPRVSLAALLLATALLAACSSPPPRPSSAAQTSAQAHHQNGARALRRGDLNAALAAYNEALAASDSVEDFEGSATALLNLAVVHARLAQADPAQARAHLDAAHARVDRILTAPQRYSDTQRSRAATRKAMLYLDAQAQGLALHWADQARAVCADPCPLAPTLANLRAFVAFERGEAARAADQASRAAELAAAMGQETEHANALRLLGRANTRLGKTDEAAQALESALRIDRDLGMPERIALDLMHAGENEERRGRAAAAREFYERALQVSVGGNLPNLVEVLRVRLEKTGQATPR